MTKKTKVFWTLEEEDLVCKQYELMVKTNNLKDSMAASWHFAQQMLKPDRRKSLSNTQLQLERFHAWQKDGVKALIRERKPRKDKPRTAAKARQAPGPVNVLIGQSAQEALAPPNMKTVALVDQYVAGTLPGSPAEVAREEARKQFMGSITIDGLLSELVARAAVQALVPMTAEMKSSLIEVVIYQRNEFAQMLADHKAVIEGMLEDNYTKLTNFWNAPVNTSATPKSVAETAAPIIVKPAGQLRDQVQAALEKVAARVPTRAQKPSVYVAGAKPWVKQLSEKMPHVDIVCGDDKNPRNIGSFDLVITTRFISHAAADSLKLQHSPNYMHVPKGGLTRVEATINEWIRSRKA